MKIENYPAEVNEVSQVDEGKIAAKRGQRFLFSLFPPRQQGKKWPRSSLHTFRGRPASRGAVTEWEGQEGAGLTGAGGQINGVKWLHLATS